MNEAADSLFPNILQEQSLVAKGRCCEHYLVMITARRGQTRVVASEAITLKCMSTAQAPRHHAARTVLS